VVGEKEGLFGDFLFLLLGEPDGYFYVVVLLGLLFVPGLLSFAGPEEGPADCPDDKDYWEQEKD
jgi:hypothetical protein